jgi:UDP-3-O-[3-hydroxymyristoyl] glucosamine N-acyltransferase
MRDLDVANSRFYDRTGPLTVNEIAALSGAAISDSTTGSMTIDDVAPLSGAQSGMLSFADSEKALGARQDSLTGIVLITLPELRVDAAQRGAITLESPTPRAAFSRAAARLFRRKRIETPSATVQKPDIHPSVHVGPGAIIADGTRLERDVQISAGAVIGPGCRFGAGSHIGANASVFCTSIGENCNILAGAVIGEAGFGVAVSSDGVVDVPHLGAVVLGERVTIGANTAIDRGVFGDTRIGDGCKIDNLCHIAHNVQLGRDVLIPAFGGVSGSTVIGDGVMFGGRVGVSDHVEIGAGAKIGSNSAVMGNVPAGETYAGAPAQPIRSHMREIAEVRRLVRYRAKTKKKD